RTSSTPRRRSLPRRRHEMNRFARAVPLARTAPARHDAAVESGDRSASVAHDVEAWPRDAVLAVVKRHWGFDAFRPLQEAAIYAGLEHRDSLVVMPTGGG